MFLLHACVAVLVACVSCVPWDTSYDQNFDFTCPQGEYLKSIESVHDNRHEDRIFHFGCEPLQNIFPEQTISKCEWSNYANDFDKLFEFQCQNDHLISGISSYHDNGKEDRRYRFYCCQPGSLVTYSCAYTAYVNTYDHVLSYRAPDGFIIRGVNSVHDNHKEDRIFKFDICHLGELNSPAVGK